VGWRLLMFASFVGSVRVNTEDIATVGAQTA